MWSNNILLYLISIFILQSIRSGPNIVCNDQLNGSMSTIKYKHLSNMDHVLGSLAVKLPNNFSACSILLTR